MALGFAGVARGLRGFLPLGAGCETSSTSTGSSSLTRAGVLTLRGLRFAGAFFGAAVSFFASLARAAGLPLAVALVAEAVLAVCAAFPRALRAGALFSVLESGVGIALSSSYVISSSDAESTVKEMFATALRGAIAAVIWALRLGAVEAAIVAGWSCDGKWDVNNTNNVNARGSASFLPHLRTTMHYNYVTATAGQCMCILLILE